MLSTGQIIEFDGGNDTSLFGEVVTRLEGLKPHYVVKTTLGAAYVSDSKIVQTFPYLEMGSTVYVFREGSKHRYSVLGVTLRLQTAIVIGRCFLTGNISLLPIQEIAKDE